MKINGNPVGAPASDPIRTSPEAYRGTQANIRLIDPIGQFRAEAEKAGLIFNSEIIGDGQIHRVPHASSKKGERDAWYVLHLDQQLPYGFFGCWKAPQFKEAWPAKSDCNGALANIFRPNIPPAAPNTADANGRERNQREAARRAKEDISNLPEAPEDHPYLIRKGVKPHGIMINSLGELIIPLRTAEGEVVTYQRILPDGTKRYLKHGARAGTFFEFFGSDETVYVGEGWATCATVFQATGCTVFAALDTSGLGAAGQIARKRFPFAKIVFAADDDRTKPDNPGLTSARAAAELCGGIVAYPQFSPTERALPSPPSDFNDLAQLRGNLEVVVEQLNTYSEIPSSSFQFTRIDQLQLGEIDWLIEDYIETDSILDIFGDPGTGKSFIAIDIACCVATGRSWHGHEVKKSGGAVFYIAGEGHSGFARRFKAWEMGTGQSIAGAPIYKSEHAALLYNAAEAERVRDAVMQLALQSGTKPVLVIIDTLARNMGADENSARDMSIFISHLDIYLRQPWGCTVLVVHHSGAMDKLRSRGSTALPGAVDADYKVELDSAANHVRMTCIKQKDAPKGAPKFFHIATVDLPVNDKHGRPVQGAYLAPLQASEISTSPPPRKAFLGKNEQRALRVLIEMEKADRLWLGTGGQPTSDEWRGQSIAAGIERNRFAEARKSLLEKGLVKLIGDTVTTDRNQPVSSVSDATDMSS